MELSCASLVGAVPDGTHLRAAYCLGVKYTLCEERKLLSVYKTVTMSLTGGGCIMGVARSLGSRQDGSCSGSRAICVAKLCICIGASAKVQQI
eukprot:3086626-Amphidinium_carterae.1